jgi:glycosyltransferase involved in cell wall biosynthesis
VKAPASVLQLVNQFAIGGAEGQFVERVRCHPEGFRPVVACVNRAGPHLEVLRSLGFQVEEFGLRGSLAQLNTAHQILRLAAFIERESVQLVHANDFYANLIAVPAARLVGAKVICSRFDLGHWYSRAQHMVEALTCRAADAIFVNANAVRDMCVDEEGIAATSIAVIRIGIDLRAFDAAAKKPLEKEVPQGRPTIVMVGNLHPVKGHLDLIDAIARIKPHFPDLLVLCAGEGPMRAVIEQQIAHHGLRETVLLLGHRWDVPALLSRAQVACLPSHAEGLSNALIEEMAAALPVVATAVGGNVELVVEAGPGASGHLVPPNQPAALAERLAALLRDPQRCRALGAAARKRVQEELTLEEMTRRTGELYRALLQSRPERKAA